MTCQPWIQKLVERAEGGDAEAVNILATACDSATRKASRGHGQGERAALFRVLTALREVYPELSQRSRPDTIASQTQMLVREYMAERDRCMPGEASVDFAKCLEALAQSKVTQ